MKMILKSTLSLLLLVTLAACQNEVDAEAKVEVEDEVSMEGYATSEDLSDTDALLEKLNPAFEQYRDGYAAYYNQCKRDINTDGRNGTPSD